MRFAWWLLVLVACGRQQVAGVSCGANGACPSQLVCVDEICRAAGGVDAFVPLDDSLQGDGQAADAPPGSHAIPSGAALWLASDDDPTDGALDSAGTHTSSCTACPTLTTGKFASAYQFNSNRILVTSAANLNPGTAFTFAAWVRIDAAPSTTATVACKGASTLCSYGLLLNQNRTPVFYTYNQNLTGTTALNLGAWYHLAITWDGTTKRGYLNGASAGTVAVASITSDTMPLSIGQFTTASPLPLAGTVDDIVFYNRALTAAEIVMLATP